MWTINNLVQAIADKRVAAISRWQWRGERNREKN